MTFVLSLSDPEGYGGSVSEEETAAAVAEAEEIAARCPMGAGIEIRPVRS
ncbi:hypothetical protein OUY22_21105 [Nonomuraea sp. MCN248]|uniref:Ferredoxin n=1 Tax=Nonomuraea corallina TaxID=2989783 RepID=A0ABT4SFX7_9ACTN|nr:hypothetical protein [Nonomuraea corallina]MDA0635928.1 hypothetical protein [Nonomuraea corallina]